MLGALKCWISLLLSAHCRKLLYFSALKCSQVKLLAAKFSLLYSSAEKCYIIVLQNSSCCEILIAVFY